MNFSRKLATATLVAFFGLAGAATASTIQVFNDLDKSAESDSGVGGLPGGLRGTVGCTETCSVLSYNRILADEYAFGSPGEVFDGPGKSGDKFEADWVNTVILDATGTDPEFTASDVGDDYQDNGNAFTTDALYVIFKIGNKPDYIVIQNDYSGSQTFSFAQAAGAQGALSHSFGLGTTCVATPENNFCNPGPPVNVVPLPAGLPLLLGALGVFGIAARRKSRRS